jgi:hypothetical protein
MLWCAQLPLGCLFAMETGSTPATGQGGCKGLDWTGVRRWALDVQSRTNHNKAACALANKLARICYATLRDKQSFGDNERLQRKVNRESFVMPA